MLVVADEIAVAELITETLAQSDYGARVALTAGDAVAIATIDRPAAIVLDINLPDSFGMSTLSCLRQLRPDVPIIMLTANTDDELAPVTRSSVARSIT